MLNEFYSINTIPIPNWLSHFILLFFHTILPSWLAEKFFLIFYVSGMALSFRYLIKILNPDNISLSILIFPFIYSFLFYLGFYNFSFSFILYFISFGFWLRNYNSKQVYKYLILFCLFTISYFTNLLMLGFLGLTIGLYILYFSYKKYLENKNEREAVLFGGNKLLLLLIISLPSLIFGLVFFMNSHFFSSNSGYSITELIKWINDARSFIVYEYVGDEILTEQFFHVLLLLLAFSFVIKNKNKTIAKRANMEKANIIAIPLTLSILLFLVTPNGTGAGMMSDRYCLILYMLGLLWVISRSVKTRLNSIIIISVLLLHFGLILKHLNRGIRNFNENAMVINNASYYVDDNSIVLPINFSENWIEPHFSNYLGVDKPMIILENYEASIGWFPVKWDLKNIPNVVLGDKKSISGVHWPTNTKSKNIKQIDYILLYGNLNKINDSKWRELKEQLSTRFNLKYKSENNYLKLYEIVPKQKL